MNDNSMVIEVNEEEEVFKIDGIGDIFPLLLSLDDLGRFLECLGIECDIVYR